MFSKDDLIIVSKPPLEKYNDGDHTIYYGQHMKLYSDKTVLRISSVSETWVEVDTHHLGFYYTIIPIDAIEKVFEL